MIRVCLVDDQTLVRQGIRSLLALDDGIEARDDGAGADAIIPGNGLRGMRERLAQHGGALQLESAPGTGFRLRLSLPTLGVGPAVCANECPEGATP